MGYKLVSYREKIISKYCNISILEVEELDLVEYLFYYREAVIYNCMQTEDGIEYLQNAYRLEQTEPDREKLREKYNSGRPDTN